MAAAVSALGRDAVHRSAQETDGSVRARAGRRRPPHTSGHHWHDATSKYLAAAAASGSSDSESVTLPTRSLQAVTCQCPAQSP